MTLEQCTSCQSCRGIYDTAIKRHGTYTYLSCRHYSDIIMTTMASQITSVSIVYLTVCSGPDQRKHQSSASLALCVGNSPGTGEFPAQRANNAENGSIWWRHNDTEVRHPCTDTVYLKLVHGQIIIFLGDVIAHPTVNFNGVLSKPLWMSNYIPLLYMDIIIYPRPNPEPGLANLS